MKRRLERASKVNKRNADRKGDGAPKATPKTTTPARERKALSAAEQKALIRYIETENVAKVKAAVAGRDVNVSIPLKHGRTTTPLALAASMINADIVRAIVEAGADVNERSKYDKTALHLVRSAAMARPLLAAGADVNAKTVDGLTPLHIACARGADNEDLVTCLLDAGADVNAVDKEKKTPFVAAHNSAIRDILKARGAKGLAKTDGQLLKAKAGAVAPAKLGAVEKGALAVDERGRVWFVIDHPTAIACWDGKKIERFAFAQSFSPREVGIGPKGIVYFSTNWGLLRSSGAEWRLYSMDNSELHDNHITEMAMSRAGHPHLMGYGGKEELDRPVSVFDGKSFRVLRAGSGLAKGLAVTCIAFDEKDRIVLGTKRGVVFSDASKWKPREGDGEVRAMVVDGHLLWAVADRNELYRIDLATKKASRTTMPNGVKALVIDGNGGVWVGLSYGGLAHVDGAGKVTRIWKKDAGLPGDDVTALALGRDGTLWIVADQRLATLVEGTARAFDGGAPSAARPAPLKATPAKAEKPKERKLPLPAEPFVRAAKLPKHVVDAVRSANLEGITADALLRFVRPAIGVEIGKPGSIAVGRSKWGGRPDLPAGAAWPTFEEEDDRCLPFLLQIDLADVTAHDLEGRLPKKGLLSFFSNTVPDELDEARVLLSADKKLARAAWPEDLVDRKDQDDFVAQLPEHAVSFYTTWTLPSREYLARFAELTRADEDAIATIDEALHAKDPKGSATTRLLGWADHLQGEADDPRAVTLLQLDGSMKAPKPGYKDLFGYWGHGLAHFVIADDDLAKRDFKSAEAMLAYT